MFIIAIVNRKGGSGKSTLATHLAVHFSRQGGTVMLGDVDKQQSTRVWLKLREARLGAEESRIVNWVADPKNVLRPPPGVTHVVLDTPGGFTGLELARVVMVADVVLMPVRSSVFDRDSAMQCLAELRTMPRVANGRCRLGVVGMRMDPQTHSQQALEDWAVHQQVPLLGTIRDAPIYIRSIEQGLTLFDHPSGRAARVDLPQWEPILNWLDKALPANRPKGESRPMVNPNGGTSSVIAPPRVSPTEAREGPQPPRLPLNPTQLFVQEHSAPGVVGRLLDKVPGWRTLTGRR